MITASLITVMIMAMSTILFNSQPERSSPQLSPYLPEGYALLFFDEFDTQGLDTSRWQHRYAEGHPYGAGLASHDSLIQEGDGYLQLLTRYQNGYFLTGMIRSIPQFRYGYFEARIRFQIHQGHHGAFWLQSESYGQRVGNPAESGAEIDIIEFFGNGRIATDARQNVYYDPYLPDQPQPGAEFELFYRDQHSSQELSEDFHIFGLLWTEDAYIFFIDGLETWRTTVGLSHVPEYIVLSLTTSAWENPLLETNKLPDLMLIDYVRVYNYP